MDVTPEVLTDNEIQAAYSEGGIMSDWDNKSNKFIDKWTQDVYRLLREEQILVDKPSNNFVFLGVASNHGTKEARLAELWDQQLDSNIQPRFLITDFFSKRDTTDTFQPGFSVSKKPHVKTIKFDYASAQAEYLPVGASSVDVVFDIRGAVWHTLYKRIWKQIAEHDDDIDVITVPTEIKEEIKKDLKKLLNEYKRVIKQSGSIIIDDNPISSDLSTGSLLDIVLGEKLDDFLQENGLDYKGLGEENDSVGLLLMRPRVIT